MQTLLSKSLKSQAAQGNVFMYDEWLEQKTKFVKGRFEPR
jgi:hypothetical protein